MRWLYSLLDDYKVDSEDVRDFTDALASQYRRRKVDTRGDAIYNDMCHAQSNIGETTEKLQADVDEARVQFKADKADLDELKTHKAPNLYGLTQCFKIAGSQKGKSPFDDMFAQMLAEIMRQMIEEQRRQAREEAEKRLYESRKNMWDAEKRLKAANRAIDHEMSRTGGRRVTSHLQYVYEADRAAHKTDSEQYE